MFVISNNLYLNNLYLNSRKRNILYLKILIHFISKNTNTTIIKKLEHDHKHNKGQI